MSGVAEAGVRRAEIMMALSHATDLVMGQPVEYALRACVLATRLAGVLGLPADVVREVYHHALLRYLGCNAETDVMAALFGDEIAFRRTIAPLDMADPADLGPALLRALMRKEEGEALGAKVFRVLRGLAESRRVTLEGFQAHCETADRLARRLGFDDAIARNLHQFQERWDGKGMPAGLRGEAIAPAVRVVALAHDAIVLDETQGRAAVVAAVKKRRGKLYEPRVADAFLAHAGELMEDIAASASWDAVLALEPGPQVRLTDAQLDESLEAMGDFVDIKSPFTAGHSRAVADLAASAGKLAGLPPADVTTLRRAALVHDLGQAGVSSGILAKTTPLTDREQEALRLHPYHAERILARPAALARLGQVVSRHHERVDGSGYHRGARSEDLSRLARILAAAEVYRGMTEPRPHRAAHSPEDAATHLRREVREGRLDAEAVTAILEAAGHRVPLVRKDRVAGLTSREIEVLRQIVRGGTIAEIGKALGIAPKTAGNHIQNLYAKIGVKTRAGATLFAVENALVGQP